MSKQRVDGGGRLHCPQCHSDGRRKLLLQLRLRLLEALQVPLSAGLCQRQQHRPCQPFISQWGDAGHQLWSEYGARWKILRITGPFQLLTVAVRCWADKNVSSVEHLHSPGWDGLVLFDFVLVRSKQSRISWAMKDNDFTIYWGTNIALSTHVNMTLALACWGWLVTGLTPGSASTCPGAKKTVRPCTWWSWTSRSGWRWTRTCRATTTPASSRRPSSWRDSTTTPSSSTHCCGRPACWPEGPSSSWWWNSLSTSPGCVRRSGRSRGEHQWQGGRTNFKQKTKTRHKKEKPCDLNEQYCCLLTFSKTVNFSFKFTLSVPLSQ